MQKVVTIHSQEGNTLPMAYMEAVDANFTTGFAMSYHSKEKNLLEVMKFTERMALDDFKDIQKAYADEDVVYHFVENKTGVAEEDVQPYVLLANDKGEPIVLGYFDGQFPQFSKTDSSHPAAWHLATEFLAPKLQGIYDTMAEKKVEKLGAIFCTAFFGKEMSLLWGIGGSIILQLATKEVFTFREAQCFVDFEGWSTSNNLLYTEEAAPAASAKAEIIGAKPKTMKEQLLEKAKGVATTVAAAVTPGKPDATAVAATSPPAPTPSMKDAIPQKTEIRESSKRMGACPQDVKGNQNIKAWYRTNQINGHCPPDWKIRPVVELKPLKGVAALAEHPAATKTETAPAPNVDPAKFQKDTDPKEVGENRESKTINKKVVIPVISAEKKAKILATLDKIDLNVKQLDVGSAEIMTLEQMQALEDKYPTFSEVAGNYEIAKLMKWRYEHFLEIIESDPEGAALLMMNVRTYYFNELASKPLVEQVGADVKTSPQTSVPTSGSGKRAAEIIGAKRKTG